MKGSIGRVVKWAFRRDAVVPRDVIESQLARARRDLDGANEALARVREECARLQSERDSSAATARENEQRLSSLQRDLESHSRLMAAFCEVLAISDEAAAALARKLAQLTDASAAWLVGRGENGEIRVEASFGPESPESSAAVRTLASWWFHNQAGHSLRLAAGHMPSSAEDSEPEHLPGIDQAVLAIRLESVPVLGVLLLRDDGFSGRDEVASRELVELVSAAWRACDERADAVRKELVVQLERARAELDGRDRALEDARSELVARERKSMLGEVTATVSHELRNPLGVIRSSVFYLQRRIASADEKVVKHLDRIEQQVGLCNGVIDDLLEFTRGRQTYLVPGDVNGWLSSVIEAQASSEPTIAFRTELAADLPVIPFDSDKMRRAMADLLENAVLAVKARVEQAAGADWQPRIVARSVRRSDGVVIELADNGIGMDEPTRSRAFDPLFTTRARGTGLGLAIVRKIIDEHGGRIWLESSAGVGTTVTIVLPESLPVLNPSPEATT